MSITTIDQAKELLYGYPVESFVAERDVLVKRIRASGDRELANLTKALRKPSTVAALVNQLVRRDLQGVELILQAAALLRSAQAGALKGSGINASELQEQYRAAVGALAQSAPERRAEVRAALEAATIDEASNDDLRNGCLVVVPTPVSIFGATDRNTAASAQIADVEPASTKPVDELEARRARRRDDKAASEKAASDDAAAAKQAERAQAAAAKKAAAEAERARKAAEKEHQKKLKALQKQHREALRSHLTALDHEAAAATATEQAGNELSDVDDDIAAAELALAALRSRREQVVDARDELARVGEQAAQGVAEAEAVVEALAEQLSKLEEQ